jgi:hypothetical protein
MLDFTVYPLQLVLLSVVNFFLSWIWYSPLLFAKPWMKGLGRSPDHAMTDQEKKEMPWLFASGLVSSFLLVYALTVLVNSLWATDFLSGMCVGSFVWAGFALTHSLNTLWEGRKPVVLTINNGLFLLSYALFGGVLAVWR